MAKDRPPLADRVTKAAEAALAAQGYAAPIDVLRGLGWLDPNTMRRWQQGQIPRLEPVLQASPAGLAHAMTLFRDWAARKGLIASEAPYPARNPGRQPLVFSASGDPALERLYRTHFLSPELPERRREKLVETAAKPAELVAILPRNRDWTCHRCGGTGNLLMMEPPGPCCLKCLGLDDLDFLPSGNALLTRRAKAKSARHAIVVRFSRTRGRYERQGVLVEPEALAAAKAEVGDGER